MAVIVHVAVATLVDPVTVSGVVDPQEVTGDVPPNAQVTAPAGVAPLARGYDPTLRQTLLRQAGSDKKRQLRGSMKPSKKAVSCS